MSHFTVLVIGDDYAGQLAPYNEDIEVEPYIRQTKADVIAEMREHHAHAARCLAEYAADPDNYNGRHNANHIAWIAVHAPAEALLDDEALWAKRPTYEDYDADGNVWSTYNPRSRWDWYAIGGRWKGSIKTHSGQRVDQCVAGDTDPTAIETFAIVKDGAWHQRAQMGWWGITTDEQPDDDWRAERMALLSDLASDALLTVIDAHI